jgi:beta-glucanase (GH16 family)
MKRSQLVAAALLATIFGGLAGCSLVSCGSQTTKLVFDESFDGPAGSPPDPRRWLRRTGGNGWGNGELQTYTSRPENVALDGAGHLVVTARREHYTGADAITREFTSARLDTKDRFTLSYGRIEARVKATQGQGLWPAFWLLGAAVDSVGWPVAGEIDLMEMYGTDERAHAAVHGPSDAERGWAATGATTEFQDVARGFHTYRLDRTKGRVEVSVDGTTILTARASDRSANERWVDDAPMFLVLDLAVGGRQPGVPDDSTPLPATLEVDSIKAWTY